MPAIELPNRWQPRSYQRPLWDFLEKGGKRAIAIWHRRAGKDDVLLHRAAVAAFERPATYWHGLPEYAQARKALWAAVNPHTGKRRIDEAFPHELRESTNEQEMFIRFVNGSTWQLVGSDRYNSLVGAGVAGFTSSEFALSNPSAWGYIRPMLEENDGWAAFITTPRGRNHAQSMLEMARKNPRWFAEVLSIHDTGALTAEQIKDSLAEYIALYGEDIGRAQFEQEYEVSFNAAILGAFYAREMVALRREGRIGDIEPVEGRPVHRAWDIGVRDDTSIWWFQVVGTQIFILDCYTASGIGVDHFAEVIEQRRKEHGWTDGTDFVPHDARVKEWGTGRTRVETMQGLGLHPQVVPLAGKLDGINAARKTLARCVFHTRTEEVGISALEQYRREWDDDKKAFKASEVHDWCFVGETEIVTRYGMCQIKALPNQGEVLTPCGWKPYTHPRITRRNAPLVEVAFADGLTVRCTPDHMFMTESGWKSAESLTTGSLIQSCLTPSRSISMAASTVFGQAKNIGRAAVRSCIEMFGRALSARSQKGAIFTTGIATHQTTSWRTSNVFPLASTCQTHGEFVPSAATRDTASSMRQHASAQQLGIGPKKDVYGTSAMLSESRVGQSGSVRTGLATIVGRCFRRLCERAGILNGSVPRLAKPRTIASVRHLELRQDVWCITVPGVEAFALSNGAVVHNCSHLADAFRYLAMAWRELPAPKPEQPKPVFATIEDGYAIAPALPGQRRR